MKFTALIAAALVLAAAGPAVAVVIRHDVPDARYLVESAALPALVDLPGDGHGVLIAPSWVATVAHTVRSGAPRQVTLNGQSRAVVGLVVHPGFRVPPAELMRATGDAAPMMKALEGIDDIALIRLSEPVRDVKPMALYRKANERGRTARMFGKGATGDGLQGQAKASPNRGKLRRAENRIESAEGRWLGYRFDKGRDALPLEGMLGDGDSGSPILIRDGSVWKLAALSDRKYFDGDLAAFKPGLYGQFSYHIRISHYASWIDRVIGDSAPG